MTHFLAKYASYYDFIYAEKDYAQETAYVDALIKKYYGDAQSILEFGCGTGRHAAEFAQRGYLVHGVDVSESMIHIASQRALHDVNMTRMSFECADIRTVQVHKTFDVVVSLFHVMSYQTTSKDLLAVFQAAAQHLNPGGLFIFDVWYGPAVQEQGYHVKIKRLANREHTITRISEPHFYPAEHKIDVQFTLFVQNKATQAIEQFDEMHPMRYLFKPEIEAGLEMVGFEMCSFEEWLTGAAPNNQSWSVCCVGRKR